ncbi:nonribosomal peptide synthetase MxaA [Methylorubrum sp. POS3]|uniref:nonribosomal peptide synthetase MxaA n=1 Tax=Methylorubrum sp. POS3 TaxID=2998492 RepID=UPI0037293D68
MRALLLALLLSAVSAVMPALAQVRGVELRVPRAFGYFLGDLVPVQADIRVDPGFTLQRPSLPKPGPVTYWLDLRSVAVEERREGDATLIRLRLTYQSFYAALDSRTLEVPGFPVTIQSDGQEGLTTATVQVPAWKLGVSPLREVQPERRDDPAEYLLPDGRAPRLDPTPATAAALTLLALAALALVPLARDRAWGIFAPRRGRPFALGLKALRRMRRKTAGDARDREALLVLHRAVDATAGRRVLADDLPLFLDRHPAFRGQADDLARFFAASRRAFFGRETEAAARTLPLPEIETLLARLAAAERSA